MYIFNNIYILINKMSIENYISKVLNNDDDNSYEIISYFKINNLIDEKFIFKYIKKMFIENKELQKHSNNVKSFYEIKYNEDYNIYLKELLNKPLPKNKIFHSIICINNENEQNNNNENIIIVKVNHAYFDGYTLINMLLKTLSNEDIKINHKIPHYKSMYYYVFGTFLLFFMEMFIITKICISKIIDTFANIFFGNININSNTIINKNKNINTKIKNDFNYIICKPLNLQKIKKKSKKCGISINDFLHSLMIKTDKLYHNVNKNIFVGFPINVNKMENNLNFCMLLNMFNNSYNDSELLKLVNERFNNFKYSLYVPFYISFTNFFGKFINIETLLYLYSITMEYVDYSFTNVIGPSNEELKKTNLNINDMHFLLRPKRNEIIYSIISSDNDINIILSFKNGVIKNTMEFENCIYEAYNELINI